VQIKATPKTNYRFAKWKGDVHPSISGKPEINITMNSNRSISALFCSPCGDVNGDFAVTPLDSQAVFDIFLGRISNPTECQLENADVNVDGTVSAPRVTPADAQAIFKAFLGKKGLPSDCSCQSRTDVTTMSLGTTARLVKQDWGETPALDPQQRTVLMFISYDYRTSENQIVVPITIDNPSGIDAFGFDLIFRSDLLEFTGIARTELTQNFYQVDAHPINEGIVRVGGYSEEPITSDASGELVILIFKAKTPPDGSLFFRVANTCDDLKWTRVQSIVEIQPDRKADKNVLR